VTQWFPAFDDAVGGIADVATAPFDMAGDFVEGAASTAGNAAGGLFGGLFGGLGNWLFQLAALGVVAFVAIRVIA